MLDQLARNWWVLALRGAFAILFGILAWIWPGITVWALVILFGAYALVDGVFSIGAAIKGVPGQSRIWMAVIGACGIVAGIIAFVWPGITSLALLMLIAAWAVVTGVFEIIAAIALRKEIEGEAWYIVSGAVSILFGFLLFVWPVEGALAVIWIIGLFSIIFGVVMIASAYRLKKLGEGASATGPQPGGTAAAH